MCNFFSFLTDMRGNLYYLSQQQRNEMLPKGENGDSHSTIAHYLGITNEDFLNKWEYRPWSEELIRDHTEFVQEEAPIREKLKEIDFTQFPEYNRAISKRERVIGVESLVKGDKIRFLTRKEFADEFGYNWRSNVRYSFVSGMDKFFGVEATFNEWRDNRLMTEEGFENDRERNMNWSFSKDMVRKV